MLAFAPAAAATRIAISSHVRRVTTASSRRASMNFRSTPEKIASPKRFVGLIHVTLRVSLRRPVPGPAVWPGDRAEERDATATGPVHQPPGQPPGGGRRQDDECDEHRQPRQAVEQGDRLDPGRPAGRRRGIGVEEPVIGERDGR